MASLSDMIQSINKSVTSMTGVFTFIPNTLRIIITRLNEHVLAKGNVHSLTPGDLGLGDVPNYAPSTTPQAQNAVNNTTVMTPKRVDDWAQVNVYGPIAKAFTDAANRL